MLTLKQVTKEYQAGDTTVHALKGIDLEFRRNEFVSILGPSGCGKTTLLNIIGGLDQYTSGDLIINGKSTRDFKDSDWDTYRNHSIGFVFQNYNLIPHQTVLSNVELALTLSGVSKAERRARAIKVLEQVGLSDQINKKPNQMSGGQMQRVAIARALINDPDILLADEPTGALDTETSVQIMEILKDISKDKLIIMVTHNPDLAEYYSTRTIRLLDGVIIGDSDPCQNSSVVEPIAKPQKKEKKPSMSFFTALSLSLNNLMTKKTRTILTAFAGSIGIIGIALILALSNGIQNYISRVEEDTLSSYPLTIESETVDMTSMISTMMGSVQSSSSEHEMDKVYSSDIMSGLISSMVSEIVSNNLQQFKEFLEREDSAVAELVNDIQYGYALDMNLYKADTSQGVVQVNPSTVLDTMGFTMGSGSDTMGGAMSTSMMNSSISQVNVWEELIGNNELLASQYDVVAGSWPSAYNEVVLIVNDRNEISDYTLYSLGLKDQNELTDMFQAILAGEEVQITPTSYSYEELLALRFKLVLQPDLYQPNADGTWTDMSGDADYMKTLVDNGEEIRVVGIIRPKVDTVATSMSGSIGYTHTLTEHLINAINSSELVRQQLADPETDVFTGLPFEAQSDTGSGENAEFDISTLPEEQQAYLASLPEEERTALLAQYADAASASSGATYEGNLRLLGVTDLNSPSTISLYPKNFAAKEELLSIIADYNNQQAAEGHDENTIQYTDYVGLLMSSVSTIVDVISYVLIAFVAISLVVSSIMIGIITYISVLERTKEIGILRSIGASKRDISRVFNAETLIVGFVAGLMGILITLLLTLPINAIIESLTGISSAASLPVTGAVILVIISMFLTFIAGLIPSRLAAKKDPVEALRTE